MNKKNAFTIIELILVLSIISILISVIKINFSQSKKSLALEELNIIEEQIISAKNYSISNISNVTITSSKEDNSIDIKAKGYYFKKISCKYLKVKNSTKLIFNKDGIPDKGNSFYFSYKKNIYSIKIRPATGFVNVEK